MVHNSMTTIVHLGIGSLLEQLLRSFEDVPEEVPETRSLKHGFVHTGMPQPTEDGSILLILPQVSKKLLPAVVTS